MANERTQPRVVCAASEIELAEQRFCTCCERPLKTRVAWLELDQRVNMYHDDGGVPDDKSQGWFPFGLACARAKLRRYREAR